MSLEDDDEDGDRERGRDGLRFLLAEADPALVAATQRRVRAHALLLREEEVRRRGLTLALVLAAFLTLTTGLSVWRLSPAITWPAWVWAPSFVALWFLPGVVGAAVLIGIERRSALTQ